MWQCGSTAITMQWRDEAEPLPNPAVDSFPVTACPDTVYVYVHAGYQIQFVFIPKHQND